MVIHVRKGIWFQRHVSYCFSFFLSISHHECFGQCVEFFWKLWKTHLEADSVLFYWAQASCFETRFNMSVMNTSGERNPTSPQHYSTYLRPTSRFLSSCVWCLQQLLETSHARLWVSPGWVSVGHIFSHPPSFSYARTLFQQWLQVT